MAITNRDRIGRALELLKVGLGPFVEREFCSALEKGRATTIARQFAEDVLTRDKPIADWDAAALLKLMWESWNEVFRETLGPAERGLVGEIRGYRNRWAHQEPFSGDDADRALDSIARLLTAVSAPEADEVGRMKMELRRLIFEEQMRSEKRKGSGTAIQGAVSGTLKPWREVVTPHKDVASGRYQQAEFAADLWQVHLGEGSDEYRDPAEFFRRTYLTESLKKLLQGAALRLSGQGGDPVVQLQTNFGGGKTHSMLALYHLFSGVQPGDLLGVETLLREAELDKLPGARRVVLVGNKISPGNPSVKPDGTVVRTLWGELAWQLGGAKAYARVAADDERATSPGDVLRELLNEYGPSLILIDEWVAYARQLHDADDLPGGSFETHFSFAQALTESAKLAKGCLLVISLPASDTASSPHAQGHDEEVGGERGRAALARLRNVIGRVESSWAPASTEEGFEIVRRRLFEPMTQREQFVARDTVAREFYDFYRTQSAEFPPETKDADYEKRLKTAYPIHPEVFDRLYGDWSSLAKFQRTRGVLRLMAAVIHSLWEKGDRNPLILPANLPIDDVRVRDELTRYLPDNWRPVIEKDVDGPNALPLRIDGDVANLGKFAATRRVARTIYLGSAPMAGAANRGLEDRRIKLGSAMPGESPAVFGDALRRLATAATYLYQDGPRYWYSTQPTVTKLAEDRAEQLRRDPDAVTQELDERLRADLQIRGDFGRIHALPQSSADVPDDLDARLVVLRPEHAYSKVEDCPALAAVRSIFESRGNTPRIYRNALVFLACDATRLADLEDAVRRYLAWRSILIEKDQLDLSRPQRSQAETQQKAADAAVTARLPETYQWLLVPTQASPQATIEFSAFRLTGQDALAVRVSRKLRNDELLVSSLAPSMLRIEMDRVPLWRNGHVSIRQLIEDFAQYPYLPRLSSPVVLLQSVLDGVGLLTWEQDTFAYAEAFDEDGKRYRGLRVGENITLTEQSPVGLLVKPGLAKDQLQRERQAQAAAGVPATDGLSSGIGPDVVIDGGEFPPDSQKVSRRIAGFHGTVQLDPSRVGRDAAKVAEEVIAHLLGLSGAEVEVSLEVHARLSGEVSDAVVRTVTENCTTLRFSPSSGFESE